MSSKHNKNKRPGLPPPGYDVEAAALANGEEKSPLKKKPSKQHRDANATHRGRTFSSGSTLGAFYPLGETAAAAAAPKGLPKKRLSKRHSKHGQVPTQIPVADQQPPTFQNMGTGSDLGDVASMAIAGLGEDLNMSDLAGGPPTFSQSNQRFNGNVRAAPQAHNRRNGPSPPSSVPPLATIPDISENYSYATNDNVTPDYQRRINDPYNNMSPNSRRVMNEQFNMYGGVQRGLNKRGSVDSLRVSDVSLDDDAAKNFMSGLDREGSTYASADSFVVPNDADYGNSDRTSLVGTNLFDKRSSSSLKQQTPPYGRGTNNQMHANTWSSTHGDQLSALSENSNQNQEIASFSAMLHADYGSADAYGAGSSPQVVERKQHPLTSQGPPPRKSPKTVDQQRPSPKQMTYVGSSTEDELSDASLKEVADHRSRLLEWLDPTSWLTKDLKFDDGAPYFDDSDYWTIAGMVRSLFYNPVTPEFTSLQQFSWACLIGIFMGFYTAFWKTLIERSVDFMWKDVPETLLEWGLFTELDGAFPLYHYMWICPAIWGGILSYIFVIIPTPIPGQNEWIQNLHTIGVQSHDTFLILFVLSTLGMASGLSLGPELPLVLTSGMLGSMLAIQCKQSILQARVMNITAASAAIGGFFGFPMAGALFVLEIPHRMGLQVSSNRPSGLSCL